MITDLNADATYVTRNIEDIQPGDEVLAKDQFNPDAPLVHKRVVRTFRHDVDHLRVVAVRDFDGNVETLRTTDEHPFWVVGLGWVGAQHLKPWMHVLTPDGRDAVVQSTRFESHPEGISVYNFEVEDAHTYFVEDGQGQQTAVWVHNTCGIYEFESGGVKYVGQSSNIERRIGQHLGDKLDAGDLASVVMYPMEGSTKLEREIAEQLLIDKYGGIDSLQNLVNPIGPNRLGSMPAGYVRR